MLVTATDDMILLGSDGKPEHQTDFPLSSMSLIAGIGSTGSGKTYQAFKIQQQYNKVSNDKYDFSDPYDILYKKFTHQFYISGTSVKVERPYEYKDVLEIRQILEHIALMSDDFDDCCFAQQCIMNLNGKEPAQQIYQFTQLIELMKLQYPMLREKYPSELFKQVYKMFGIQYDGYLIRRPKISIILDDSSGESIWSGTNGNYFYRFLSRRRHFGVYDFIVAAHSITVLFGQFREIFSGYLLFRDVNAEHIKMLYNQSLGMNRFDFNYDKFLSLYQDHCGFNDSIYDQAGSKLKQHNFLYIMRQPEKRMSRNFDDPIF